MVSKTTEDALAVVAVVGALGIGGYVAYRLVSSLTNPGCTTPGTPCYSATQSYVNALQACMNEYESTLNTYLQEDNKAGTSLTQAQQANLNYLMNSCVIPQETQLSKALQPYNWQANMVTVAEYVVVGAVVYAVIRASPQIVKGILDALRTTPRTGPEMGSAAMNTTLRVEAPNLEPATLTSWADTGVYNLTSDFQALNQTNYSLLVEDGVIDQATADSLLSDANAAMEADAEETASDLLEFV
jgi:hypothetical protein